MRTVDIEAWALSVIDTVLSGATVEDARVELKSQLPDPYKAARSLAAHANASGGSDLLWLLGVDERTGPVGLPDGELADWLPQVWACFNEKHPVAVDVRVHYDGTAVTALHIETDEIPFVVKNPDFGSSKTPVELEVPWRDGTRTRSARRSDLLRLLTPLRRQPGFEVVSGSLRAQQTSDDAEWRWFLQLELFENRYLPHRLVIPFHRVTGVMAINIDSREVPLELGILNVLEHDAASAGFARRPGASDRLISGRMKKSGQLELDGPCLVALSMSGDMQLPGPIHLIERVDILITLPVVEGLHPASVSGAFNSPRDASSSTYTGSNWEWELIKSPPPGPG